MNTAEVRTFQQDPARLAALADRAGQPPYRMGTHGGAQWANGAAWPPPRPHEANSENTSLGPMGPWSFSCEPRPCFIKGQNCCLILCLMLKQVVGLCDRFG